MENPTLQEGPGALPQSAMDKIAALNAAGAELAQHMCAVLQNTRERAIALTKLEESIMWASAGVMRELAAPRVMPATGMPPGMRVRS